jgi:tetratricopeptide (TPR) repeat protein
LTDATPQTIWNTIRRARLFRVLAVYLGACLVALEVVDIFTQQLGLPDWFFPGALVILVIGLPIVIATALAQSGGGGTATPALDVDAPAHPAGDSTAPRPEASPAPLTPARRWLTWRRVTLGSVVAFAVLGVAVTGYTLMRSLGIGPVGSLVAKGVIDERERVILADFENLTGDTLIGHVVTELFRIDIAQSPIISIADPVYVAAVLGRMERDADTPLDFALAREVALREGLRALIAGEVSSLGSSYVISARLVSAESGAELASFRETAGDADEVQPAIDRLSEALRERLGESLKSIRATEPLAQVTTSSLAALQKYTQAVRAIDVEGDSDKGMALLEEALALDSTFAMAWRKLGAEAFNREEAARAVAALRKAFQYRDRLTDRERYLTIASYDIWVTGDRDQSITTLRTLLDTYPDDVYALANLADSYIYERDYERAETLGLRMIEVAPYLMIGYNITVRSQVALGESAATDSTLAAFAEKLRGNPYEIGTRFLVAAVRGDYESARRGVVELQHDWGVSPGMRWFATDMLALIARIRGRLAEAERYSIETMNIAEERGRGSDYLSEALDLALQDLWYRGQAKAATTVIETALERHPMASLPVVERPCLELASFYALAERPDRARALLADYEAARPPDMRRLDEPALHTARGDLALAEARIDDAIREYRLGDEGYCEMCMGFQLGRAYDMAEQPDSAIANYERYVNAQSFWAIFPHAYQLAPAYERLGALYEQQGDVRKAIYYYGKLVELWENADPELQPRVDAARRAMAALSGDR